MLAAKNYDVRVITAENCEVRVITSENCDVRVITAENCDVKNNKLAEYSEVLFVNENAYNINTSVYVSFSL